MAGFRDLRDMALSAERGDALLGPLRQQIERLSDVLGAASGSSSSGSFEFSPGAEVHEADESLTIRLELPGVDVRDISISATDRTIEIHGEKRSDVRRKSGDHYANERSFGAFERRFTLPYAVDPDRIEAGLDRGVLTITIARPAGGGDRVRRIAINP